MPLSPCPPAMQGWAGRPRGRIRGPRSPCRRCLLMAPGCVSSSTSPVLSCLRGANAGKPSGLPHTPERSQLRRAHLARFPPPAGTARRGPRHGCLSTFTEQSALRLISSHPWRPWRQQPSQVPCAKRPLPRPPGGREGALHGPSLAARRVWFRATPARCSLRGGGRSPEGGRALLCVEGRMTPSSDQVRPGPSRGPEHPSRAAAPRRPSPGLWPVGRTSGSPSPPWTWSLPNLGHAPGIRGSEKCPPGPAALARVSPRTGPGCTSSRGRPPTSCTGCRRY